jgi:hypothetical protein
VSGLTELCVLLLMAKLEGAQQKARLKLAEEEEEEQKAGRGAEIMHEDISPGVWVTMGIDLEDQQWVIHAINLGR